MKKLFIIFLLLFVTSSISRGQNYVNVTFRHYPTRSDVVRAFVPGTFNNWGPNDNGRIAVDAPSRMNYVDSLGCYIKTITLIPGNTHQYKFHEHYNNDGSSYDWFTDPLNPLVNYSEYHNSILNVTEAMIFEVLPRDNSVITELQPTITAGVFSTAGDPISLTQSTIYLDDSLLTTFEGHVIRSISLLRYTTPVLNSGSHKIEINLVTNNGLSVSDTININVQAMPPEIAELPDGVIDGINYIDDSTATLVLFASHKNFVYVIGDFNDWQIDDEYYMKLTPDSTRFWLTITGLVPQKEYIFQYLVDGKIRVGDPYADKVSDPFDQWISEDTYPDLIPYPVDKTTGIATVLQTAQPQYVWEVTEFERPEVQNLVIYELLMRDILAEHDYKTLTDSLAYFVRLGVNAIELMPITEFEGNESWGYNPSFYFAPDKYYGPKNDLKRFIDEAHKRGIAVIQDVVLNHAYGQCPLVRLYENNMSQSPWFNESAPHTDFAWGYDFNHESPATIDFVNRFLNYWLTEYHIDGFRFDFTRGFTNKQGYSGGYDASRIVILKRIFDQIRATDSTAYVILEHLIDDNQEMKVLAEYGMLLWGNMSYNYQEAAMGYSSDLSWGSYKKRGWNVPHLITYMESHDEERLMYKNLKWGNSSGSYNIRELNTALDRIKLVSAFFYTIPGPKMIWQFGELGYDYSIDYNGRLGNKPIRWDYYQQPARRNLYNTISALIYLKKNCAALQTEDFNMNVGGYVKRIQLNHEAVNFTIIGNFSVTSQDIVPYFQHTGEWYDYLAGDTLVVADTQAPINLAPGEFYIYSDEKIESPVSAVEKISLKSPISFKLEQNYPNPFNPVTSIYYQLPELTNVKLEIFNLLGKKVRTIIHETQEAGVHVQQWNGLNDANQPVASGIYIYHLKAGKYSSSRKMLLLR